MIFKLIFDDRTEYVQAKSIQDLKDKWDEEFDDFNDILEIIEISEEESKNIIIFNTDYDPTLPEDDDNFKEFTLYDNIIGDDFIVVASTEWV